jgi:predicted ATPase
VAVTVEEIKKISHYEILEMLGKGGMGAVYKARDTEQGKIVAIKILSNQSIQIEDLKHRFNREATTGLKLDHPNIVKIYEVGEENNTYFIVMEFIEGKTLKNIIDDGPLQPIEVINICLAAAEALGEAHNSSIIHRDIKCDNIMIAKNGNIKVMDFGLAKVQNASMLTIEGSILGTVSYMSPQQAIGEAIDHRSDIFSLGVVMYEMLTGTLPFKGDYEMAIIYSILNEEPLSIREINNTVPKSLEKVVFKALRKDPKKRFQNANELIEELNKVKQIIEGGIFVEEEDTSAVDETLLREEREFCAKLAGRDRCFEKLKGILHRITLGEGQLAFIVGEAGIGKTRLVFELEKYARTLKTRTLNSRCVFNKGVYPYQPFVEALRSYFEIKGIDDDEKLELFLNTNASELLTVLPIIKLFLNVKGSNEVVVESKEQIWDIIYRLLIKISEERPLILFIDDLHWADEDTLNLLNYIGRNSVNHRILLLGTYRPEEIELDINGPSHKLNEIKHELSREGILTVIELNRLSVEDIYSITSSLFPEADFDEVFFEKLFVETEGNPFFLIETLKLLKIEKIIFQSEGKYFLKDNYQQISIPEKVHDIILKRIGRLEKKDREILEIGSVEGESFHSGTIKFCLEINKLQLLRTLQSLEREHHIIHPADKMYRFDHSKIRDALYDAISPELKLEYHLLIADYFIENFKDDERQVPNIAQHLINGGDEIRALPYIFAAANRAKLVFANEQAIYFYQKGKKIISKNELMLPSNEINQIQIIKENLGDVLALVGKHDSALENYYSIDVSEETPLQQQIELKWKIGNVFLSKGENNKAFEIFESAENYIQKYLEEAKNMEKESGKIKLQFNVEELLNAMGKIKISKAQVFKSRGEYKIAQKEINDGLSLLKEEGNYKEKAQAYNNLGNILFDLGDYEDTLEMYSKSLELRKKILDKKGIAEAYNNLAIVYCDKGEYQKAAEVLEKSITIMKEIGFKVGLAGTSINLGAIYQDQGKYDLAFRLYKKALDISEIIENIPLKIISYSNLGSVCIDLKNFDQAVEYLKVSLDLMEKIKVKNYEAQTRSWLSVALLESGNAKEAMDTALLAEEVAINLKQKAGLGFAKRAISLIELDEIIKNKDKNLNQIKCGKIELLLKECFKIFEELKMEHELGRSYLLAARFYDSIENQNEVQNFVKQSKELFQKLGAEGDLIKLNEFEK